MNNKGLKGDITMSEKDKIVKFKKEISLEELLNYSTDYLLERISEKEYTDWLCKVEFRNYIPIEEKSEIVNNLIMKTFEYDFNYISMFSIDIEMDKFFYGLLKYTNISIADNEHLITSKTYDILSVTFGKIIYELVKEDYNNLISLYDETINFKNIMNLMDRFNVLDTKSAKAQDKTLDNLLKIIKDPEVTDKITKILTINNIK